MKIVRKLRNWIDQKINWSNLKLFGEHKFVASMYIWLFIVPLIANALINLESKFPITVFNHTFIFHSTLPFSWQAFFYSALSFTLANLIRLTFCPRVIIEHSDYASFKSSEKNHLHLIEYEREYEERGLQVYARQKKLSNPRGVSEKVTSEAFWDIHNNANNVHRLFQYICFTLYSIGIILIGVVIIQNVITVSTYL